MAADWCSGPARLHNTCGQALARPMTSGVISARSRWNRRLGSAPLSIKLIAEVSAEQTGTYAYAGFGEREAPFFWIGSGPRSGGLVHIGLTASSRQLVDAFYRAALDAGGKDNGAPGLRPHYHANYYAAFVHDLDGHNIETVCHLPR